MVAVCSLETFGHLYWDAQYDIQEMAACIDIVIITSNLILCMHFLAYGMQDVNLKY
jgi:hypothetical protein